MPTTKTTDFSFIATNIGRKNVVQWDISSKIYFIFALWKTWQKLYDNVRLQEPPYFNVEEN